MALTLPQITFSLILTLAVVDSTTHAKKASGEMTLAEKAVHHYDQLVHTLREIKKSGQGVGDLSRALRTGSGNHGNLNIANEDISTAILRSLFTSCLTIQNIGEGSETNINIFNNATVSFSSRDKKKKKSDKSSTENEVKDRDGSGSSPEGQPGTSSKFRLLTKPPGELASWMDNLVRPLNFSLKREGQLVRVTFDVLRTGPAVVSHTWTFDGERKNMKGPMDFGLEAGQLIASSIDLVFNASVCPPKSPSRSHPKREYFGFSKTSSNLDTVAVAIPTCLLDVVNGLQENGGEEFHWKEPVDEYAQKLYYPNYLANMNTSKIQTVLGKNVTFDMEIALGEEDNLIIEGLFYNATSDSTFISNNLFLQLSDREIYTQSFQHTDGPSKREELLFVEVHDSNEINGSIPGIDYKTLKGGNSLYHVSATVRITVMTGDQDVSGLLHLQHEFKLPLTSKEGANVRPIELTVTKSVHLLRPDQREAIPEGKYLIHTKRKFQCGDRGFSYYQGYGNNCTFFCNIYGRGLKNIRVRKTKGDIPPAQKYAEINGNNAILFVNLGPTRKEIDGEYECRAIEIGGKRHKWTLTVGTWGFPEVKETILDVEDDSSTFVCVVASERPVNILVSLYVGREASRIDDNANVSRVMNQSDNETRLEVTFPTSYLKWPHEFVACEASNEAGEDMGMESIRMFDLPNYYYQTNHPFLLPKESQVIDHRDGDAIVHCVATGKEPLQIIFYFDHQTNEDGLVKNNSMNVIITERDGDKTSTRLKIPKASLSWPHRTISCQAENQYDYLQEADPGQRGEERWRLSSNKAEVGKNWSSLAVLARDRQGWRSFVDGPCSTRGWEGEEEECCR